MKRARRWTVMLLVVLTGVVAGFARLDGDGAAPSVVSPVKAPEEDGTADMTVALRCFRQFAQFLDEVTSGVDNAPALPPLEQLPLLPGELLPSRG